MKVLQSIRNFLARTFRDLGINTPGWTEYFMFGGGNLSSSGVRVSEHNALLISTVYQCVRVIADTVASLPFFVYERIADGKNKATEHPLYTVLHDRPNPLMTPFEFKQTLTGHLCLWGNAYAEIERIGGRVVNLWPLRPDRMRLQQFNEALFYYYMTPEGKEVQLTDVFHLRGLSSDGIVGYSPIQLAREQLGLARASEEYRARFFKNDARPGGYLEHPAQLSDKAFTRLQANWRENHEGVANRGRFAILEEGMKWQDVGIPPDDAQFIQGQEYQKSDIAAIYRVPSYKIGLLKPGTVSYASVEQQAIDFVVDCIRPWLVCWEERATLALLTPAERRIFFAEFLVDALLRGDSQQRAAFYKSMWEIGVFSQNDILAKENMNTIGEIGNRRYVPLNFAPVDLVDQIVLAKTQPKPSTPTEPDERALPTVVNVLNGHANGAAHE